MINRFQKKKKKEKKTNQLTCKKVKWRNYAKGINSDQQIVIAMIDLQLGNEKDSL